jgi:excisionase family DNA binding protein
MALEEGWVNIGEVASHLSVGKDTIYRWIETRGFPARKAGRLLRFRLSEVDDWVEGGGGNEPETRPAGNLASKESPDARVGTSEKGE